MTHSTKIAVAIILTFLNLFIYANLFNLVDFSQTWQFSFTSPKLAAVVKKVLKDQQGQYAVVVKSLVGEDSYRFNANQIFPAGSLYKLFLLAQAYQEIEDGGLSFETVIRADQKHLEEVLGFAEFGYPSTSTEQTQISYSVAEILRRIATISDNFAAIMLAEKIGWDKVSTMAKNLGADHTTIKAPISTTASDIALFYEKLYQGKVVSRESSDQIIKLLSQSKLNDRLPAKLPQGVKVAHKTAELARLRHDAGIVYLDPSTSSGPYIVVLLSKDLKYEDDGVETLANLSKEVYDYFVNNKK